MDQKPAEEKKDAPAAAAPSSDQAAPSQASTAPATGGDTQQNPPAAPNQPAEGSADPAKEPAKKGFSKKKLIMIGGGVLVIVVIALAAFLMVKKVKSAKSSDTASVSQNPQPEASQSATADSQPVLPDCISGYKPYANKQFSICYPVSMSLSTEATGSAKASKQYTFQDDVETLVVQTDYKDNLNKYQCTTSEVATLSGYQGVSYVIKDFSQTDGCLDTIDSYAAVVSAGNNKPVYYIGLSKKDHSTYQSDNGEFDIIQNSFTINNP